MRRLRFFVHSDGAIIKSRGNGSWHWTTCGGLQRVDEGLWRMVLDGEESILSAPTVVQAVRGATRKVNEHRIT